MWAGVKGGRWNGTYPVEVDTDRAAGIQGCCLPMERRHFADDADGLVGELFEVLGVDSGSGFVCHFGERGEVVERVGRRANRSINRDARG